MILALRWCRALAATALLLPCLAAPAAAQAIHAPAPVTLLTVPDTTNGRYPPRLGSLTRDPSGRLYLSTGGIPPILFEPDAALGRYLRTRAGHRALGRTLGWAGDTLTVDAFYTWTLFGADGTSLGCRAFEQMHNEFATQVFPLLLLSGDLALGELTPAYPDPRHPQSLVVSRGQTVLRTLHQRPSGPYRVDVPFPWGGGLMSVVVPFTAQTMWAASDDGAHVVVLESAQPTGPGPHPVRVIRMDPGGRIAYDVRLAIQARRVTDAERERELDAWARSMAGGTIPRDTAAAREAFRARIRFPGYHPAVAEMRVARDGAAWLRLPDADGATPWLRLDAGGAEDLRLSLPSDFRAAYADADALWGEMRGPDGTLRVVAYPLPGRPPLVPPGFAGLRLPAEQPPPPASLVRGRC